MQEPVADREITYAEFLAFVADKDERYEYVDGHAVAMGAANDVHQRLAKRSRSMDTSPVVRVKCYQHPHSGRSLSVVNAFLT